MATKIKDKNQPPTPQISKAGASLVYITGCDGTGKTTQVALILEELTRMGLRPQHRYLRFPFFFSIPLLLFARWRGYSWYEQNGDIVHGYWDFYHSRLLQVVLPWLLLMDAALVAAGRIYLPLLFGSVVVCERFILDMLVDLGVAFRDLEFYRRLPGRLYIRLLPRGTQIVILDLDAKTIQERRPDLRTDRQLELRLEAFRRLAFGLSLPVLSNDGSISELHQQILGRIDIEG